MRTMAFRVVRRVHVAVHTDHAPTDAEWRTYLDNIGAHLAELDACYVVTHGGDLSAHQRDEARRFWEPKKRKLPVAVVTGSVLVRALATTLRFLFGGEIKPFAPNETGAALAFLGVSQDDQVEVRRAVAELERELGIDR